LTPLGVMPSSGLESQFHWIPPAQL
jgi:hypothetical protein